MLTGRQREIYEYIKGSVETKGVCPSYREIGDAFGMSRGHAHDMVDRLVERGHVRRLAYRARALEIVDKQDRPQVRPVIHYRNAAYFRWNDETKELAPWPPK